MERVVIGLLLALCMAHVQGASEDPIKMSMREVGENMKMHIIQESKCLEKENLTMEEVKAFSSDENLELAESKPQLKCFAACLFEHTGIMDNCKMDVDKFANNDALKDVHKALATCKVAENGGERCQCAYQLMKCMLEQKASEEADD